MRKSAFLTLILASVVLFTSCGKEKLTPMVSAVTVNELRNDQPINFSYRIDSTQIDEYARGAGKFPVFGKLFQAIAFVLANTTISSKGGHELELDPIDVDLDSLGDIDFDYIDWIRLDSLLAHIDNAKKKDSLEFIEKVEIYALLNKPIAGLPVDDNGMTRLVYFDKKTHPLECNGRCLNLRIEKVNWKEIIKNNPKIKLQPKIIINSVPKSTMALAGSVSFSIKFNLGF
ncbi:hypothetical protein DOM21_05995 [Bacteriovorax stolpii]|uniref:Uncharacterized protein n=1 Tax=Bacteriovorax stolpii TaxID=960 RepID=A0A2K9NU18_BACTC|nr:hypothetical protein [Bacteriovorax stolpii]AUN98992.1 hypothetical protein C0V70_12945 [Bacteriovorax stolpii]QDK41012.1 hypothetical protein DOM21_05995 [Bacteriovorax stolpii]TDP55484.1 hypothetical protein C8D79_0534 [Bacteriovorax stolpii]